MARNKLNSAVSLLEKEVNQIPLMYYSATTLVDDKIRFISENILFTKKGVTRPRFIFNDMFLVKYLLCLIIF